MCATEGTVHVPLPLDHFFFCFLPPVGAGAWKVLALLF